jgi:methionine sulfoxide reductase heme-binding subunit
VLTWILLRAAGIGAYVMLWATVSWGLIGTTSLVGKRVSRATSITFRQFLAASAFLLIGVHIGSLLLDTFVHFTPLDVAIPLHTKYKTVPVALGIASMYAVALVLISSWARRRLSTTWWRRLHLLSVPAFALALVHGVFTGTDVVRSWMWWSYVLTGGTVLFLMLTRALTVGLRPERHDPPLGVKTRARIPGQAAISTPKEPTSSRTPVPAVRRPPLPRGDAHRGGRPAAPSVVVPSNQFVTAHPAFRNGSPSTDGEATEPWVGSLLSCGDSERFPVRRLVRPRSLWCEDAERQQGS